MATFKTLADAYEHIDALFFERTTLGACDYGMLKDLLNAYGFTKAQKTVALANVYEDVADCDNTRSIIVLHQTDDGFEWESVGYYDCIYEEVVIYEA